MKSTLAVLADRRNSLGTTCGSYRLWTKARLVHGCELDSDRVLL